ncbi:tyrosine--tRNA ligase, partial [Patescibacteria group bacterium]|nr:tyrosine--tRNA ligase [Patescibacteria group bacterium]
ANSKDYQRQASSFLDFDSKNPATVKYNSEWNDKLSFKDLIELSSNFTVQQMLQRDMFQKRQEEEKPIYLHEFLYPLTQAYDSVAMDVDLEIGGNDQMFNMMCGRDLLKTLKNKEKFVLTMKLLADESGKKMGKSEGNVVFLDEEASEIYGKVMSWPDEVMSVAFELCTQITWQEVQEIQKQLKTKDVNFRDMKMKLAKEITASIKGDKEAQEAEKHFIKTIQKKEVPDNIEEISLKKDNLNILELLVVTKLTNSKGEARRLINQNGLKIDGDIVSSTDLEINLEKPKLIQKGKRHFLKVKK